MRNMVEFQWERTKFFDTDAVLDILPTPLRTLVLLDMNKTFIHTVPFFQDQDEAIIKEIVQVLGHELILPGTLVVHEGQPADRMFFTRFGRFEVLAPHSFVVIQDIGVGGYFGEIGLLVNHGRYSATVRASPNTRCEVATLSRADLDKLMNTFPVFSRSFRRVGLSRLRNTRNNFLKSRFTGQTEYRIVFEIIKGHNLLPEGDQSVVIAELVTRTCRKKRKKVGKSGKSNGNGGDGEEPEDIGHRQIGRAHRTDRRRGKSPYFGNVFVIEICCHEMQRIESLEFFITLYQCHSWRPRTYIGSIKVHPVDIRLGQVTKQWYRLKNMETPSECDVIMGACAAERQGRKKRKKKTAMGQLLLRMIRHRDSGGRDAQLRASQGIRELSKSTKHDTSMTAEHSVALSRQEKILQARASKKRLKGDKSGTPVDGGDGGTKKKSWKNIKKKFLNTGHVKQEFEDGLRFGAQMTMLDSFSSVLKRRRDGPPGGNSSKTSEAKAGSGGAAIDTGCSNVQVVSSKDSRDSMERSIGQCGKLCDMGRQLQKNLVLMAQKRQDAADMVASETLGF